MERDHDSSPANQPRRAVILRRSDQACAAAVIAVSLAVMAGYWIKEWGRQDDLIDLEAPPQFVITYEVDINTAPWTEFAVLPGIGEVLARRIVESRQAQGPFRDHDDLQRVRGIGPRTLEKMRPFLKPMPGAESFVGQ